MEGRTAGRMNGLTDDHRDGPMNGLTGDHRDGPMNGLTGEQRDGRINGLKDVDEWMDDGRRDKEAENRRRKAHYLLTE